MADTFPAEASAEELAAASEAVALGARVCALSSRWGLLVAVLRLGAERRWIPSLEELEWLG
jgi:hypothetical protein